MANHDRLKPVRVLDAPRGGEYDEETFRYFLSIEQARAARSNQPLRLLLASLDAGVHPPDFSRSVSTKVFGAMRAALRDTDVVGWYQQDKVAAAVLTALPVVEDGHAAQLEKRVVEGVRRHLPAKMAIRLTVTVVRGELAERGTA